jgi:hypothetical protein
VTNTESVMRARETIDRSDEPNLIVHHAANVPRLTAENGLRLAQQDVEGGALADLGRNSLVVAFKISR